MKLKFAFFTWLIAILLNSIFSTLYLSHDSMYAELAEWSGLLLASSVFTLLFSLPGFAGIFLWIWVADNFYFSSIKKFICFSIGCLITTLLCYVLLSSILGIPITELKFYHLMLLSMLSVLTALLVQRKYFYRIVMPDFD